MVVRADRLICCVKVVGGGVRDANGGVGVLSVTAGCGGCASVGIGSVDLFDGRESSCGGSGGSGGEDEPGDGGGVG